MHREHDHISQNRRKDVDWAKLRGASVPHIDGGYSHLWLNGSGIPKIIHSHGSPLVLAGIWEIS